MRSNNLTEVTSQSYIAFFAILYSSTYATIYLLYMGVLCNGLLNVTFRREGVATYIGQWANQYRIKVCAYIARDADLYSFAR